MTASLPQQIEVKTKLMPNKVSFIYETRNAKN
jgi:hypothetical protein